MHVPSNDIDEKHGAPNALASPLHEQRSTIGSGDQRVDTLRDRSGEFMHFWCFGRPASSDFDRDHELYVVDGRAEDVLVQRVFGTE